MDIREAKMHLRRQLSFIERSCKAYDCGFQDEAIRIAQTIRVLLHDTGSSTSLLKSMGQKSKINLLTSCDTSPFQTGLATYDGVSIMTMEGLQPCLSESGFCAYVPFNLWWEQVVLVTGPDQHHSRKSIVLATANKDGGAHIDDNITSEFETLKKAFGLLSATAPPLN